MDKRSEKFRHIISIFKRIFFLIFLFFSIFFLSACSVNNEESMGCTLPSNEFSKDDLIGTWMAKDYSTGNTDTLIFRDDGQYKQIIDFRLTTWVDYETGWQTWRLEYGDKGIPYLYLQDLRYCAAGVYDCNSVRDDNTSWSDCCNDGPTKPVLGEGVLTILGPPDYWTPTASMSDISLTMFRGCESSAWSYEFQNP